MDKKDVNRVFGELEELQAENKRLKEKIDLALLELAHIEGEKTPTEIRIKNILQEKP